MNKFWHPDMEQVYRLAMESRQCGPLIVDVGGSPAFTFPAATESVGWNSTTVCNLDCDPLPYADQSVDFLYCRHTLEDLANPEHLLSEIRRVAKAGYVETPSPWAELSRGVDAAGDHVGYIHHRWIFYRQDDTLVVLPKYPVVERMPLFEETCQKQLQLAPRWNTMFRFTSPLKYEVRKHEQHFSLAHRDNRGVAIQYWEELQRAVYGGEP